MLSKPASWCPADLAWKLASQMRTLGIPSHQFFSTWPNMHGCLQLCFWPHDCPWQGTLDASALSDMAPYRSASGLHKTISIEQNGPQQV